MDVTETDNSKKNQAGSSLNTTESKNNTEALPRTGQVVGLINLLGLLLVAVGLYLRGSFRKSSGAKSKL